MDCALCGAKVEKHVADAYTDEVEENFDPLCEECLSQVVMSLLSWMEAAGLAFCTVDEQRTLN